MALIELNNVDLTFHVRQAGRISLKEYLLQGVFRRSRKNRLDVPALRNVSLDIGAGTRLGVLGRNGAGKTTLLKLIAGVYPPSRGRRTIRGRISSLFDISLGFEMEATGWENILFRGYLQGETPKTIRPKVEPIAEFSGLGKFLDMPVRYYSAGMLVRLAFSIATAIEPEILLIDEVFGAGDLDFQVKARQRMQGLISNAQAVVMVGHDLKTLEMVCNEGVWMDQGVIRHRGPIRETIDAYLSAGSPSVLQAA